MTHDQPIQQQTIRVDRGQLLTAGGVFPVSRIDGTQVTGRAAEIEGSVRASARLLFGRVFKISLFPVTVLTIMSLTAVVVAASVPSARGEVLNPKALAGMAITLVVMWVPVILFRTIYMKLQPKVAYWHELEIWVSGRPQLVVEASHPDPLWKIQHEIATAQRDLAYVGPTILIGQVNQVSGNNNAANFGGARNIANTGGA